MKITTIMVKNDTYTYFDNIANIQDRHSQKKKRYRMFMHRKFLGENSRNWTVISTENDKQ